MRYADDALLFLAFFFSFELCCFFFLGSYYCPGPLKYYI